MRNTKMNKRKKYWIICKYHYGLLRCLTNTGSYHLFSDSNAVMFNHPPVDYLQPEHGEFIARVHSRKCPVEINLKGIFQDRSYPRTTKIVMFEKKTSIKLGA